MKLYEKPVVEAIEDVAEVVCADGSNGSSNDIVGGDNGTKVVCRFGRTEASPGADACQSCSKTNGESATAQAFRGDYTYCIEGLPEKDS